MGYLNNSTITVDAILTKRGRELLAQGRSGANGARFEITSFALADDEVDYDLWNPAHPLGSDYYGAVIENMPITEAIPDETQSMKYKLVTFPKGTKQLPYLQSDKSSVSINASSAAGDGLITISTYFHGGGIGSVTANQFNRSEGYSVLLLDNTYVSMTNGSDTSLLNAITLYQNQPASSVSAKLTPIGSATNNEIKIKLDVTTNAETISENKSTKIIVTGIETGGRIVIPITITPVPVGG